MYRNTRIIKLVLLYMSRKEIDPQTEKMGKSFSDKIKLERKKRELSQSELSSISRVPLDTLRSIENGRIKTPNVFIADRLVTALKGNLNKWLSEIKRENEL